MTEYWVGWSHRSGDGHHDAQATPCRSIEEQRLILADENLWPPRHSPSTTWTTFNGAVV